MESIVSCLFALVTAPLLPGIHSQGKGLFCRKNKVRRYSSNTTPLFKLLKKGSVYSTSTSLIFKMGPTVSCATGAVMVLFFFPFAGIEPVFSFHGDVIVLFYLMGLGRLFNHPGRP